MTNEEKKNVEIVKFDTPYTNAISRQAAIDAMREETCLSCWDAKYILENLPSVSTEKTGRWIETSGVDMFVCSVCNDSFYPMPTCMGKPLMKYCPNCGAKMGGVEE